MCLLLIQTLYSILIRQIYVIYSVILLCPVIERNEYVSLSWVFFSPTKEIVYSKQMFMAFE